MSREIAEKVLDLLDRKHSCALLFAFNGAVEECPCEFPDPIAPIPRSKRPRSSSLRATAIRLRRGSFAAMLTQRTPTNNRNDQVGSDCGARAESDGGT